MKINIERIKNEHFDYLKCFFKLRKTFFYDVNDNYNEFYFLAKIFILDKCNVIPNNKINEIKTEKRLYYKGIL